MTKRKPGAVMGRPRKWKVTAVDEETFKKSHTETVVKLMEAGYFDPQICAVLNITEDTFKRWQRENEDFAHAVALGRPKFVHYWLTEGKKRLENENEKGFKYWKTLVDQLLPKYMDWNASSSKSGTTVNINTMQVVQKTPQELLESIKANFSQLYPHTKTELIEYSPEIKDILDGTEENT